MAKKRKPRAKKAPPAAPVPAAPPPAEPRFWFGFEISWAKLALARFVFFGMLALDALMQIRHAPRYGAGGFNVAQLPGLDALGPGRSAFGLCELVLAYLFASFALGKATRVGVPIAAAIYAWLYFGSQLDSYQHHYLVALLLFIACFVPWQRPDGARADTPVRSWALRLFLVQLAIMYLWAAISKLDIAWLDGTTLSQQIHGSMRSLMDATVGVPVASCMIAATELTLAATVWCRRTWWVAAPLGLLLHLGILLCHLDIGLFAWIMLAIYAFVVPDRIWIALARLVAPLRLDEMWSALAARASWLVWGVGLAGAVGLASVCRFEHALAAAIVLSVVLAARTSLALPRGRAVVAALGAVHLVAIAMWVVTDRNTDLASEYYRYWAGSSRRLGDPESAMRAYRGLVDVAPDDPTGHYHLGELLLGKDRSDEGLAELHEAERLDPGDARAFAAEAEWLARHGRRDEALQKARAAAHAAPRDPGVHQLLEALEPR